MGDHEKDSSGGAPAEVAVDFELNDVATSCPHCPGWRQEITTDGNGTEVSREWHRPPCPVVVNWL